MAFSFPPVSSLRQRSSLKWFRNPQSRVALGVAAGSLLIGIVLGAAFGDRLLDRGIPVRVSNVPEINRLIEKVSRHIVVSASENPTVATVQSPDLLRQQNPVFYKDVETGDRLIVWSDRAVLYSTKRDLILAAIVTPTQPAGGPTAQQAGTNAAPLPADFSFEVRNGTGKPGSAKWLGDRLTEAKFTVKAVGDAAKTYPTTQVIFLTDRAKKIDPQQLLPLTGGAVGTLPSGEKASSADVLIILGTDQG